LGEPLRGAFAPLASGYPLHHPHRLWRLRVVPLLSLSLQNLQIFAPKVPNQGLLRFCISQLEFCFGLLHFCIRLLEFCFGLLRFCIRQLEFCFALLRFCIRQLEFCISLLHFCIRQLEFCIH